VRRNMWAFGSQIHCRKSPFDVVVLSDVLEHLAARIDRGQVQLLTRSGLDWTAKYLATAAALGKLTITPKAKQRAAAREVAAWDAGSGGEPRGANDLMTTGSNTALTA
jgi:hypothetical protein